MNPDQEYSSELEIKEQQNTKKQNQSIKPTRHRLKEKLFPSSSPSYLCMQTNYRQKINLLIILVTRNIC